MLFVFIVGISAVFYPYSGRRGIAVRGFVLSPYDDIM